MADRIVNSVFFDEMIFASLNGVMRPLAPKRGAQWGMVLATAEQTLGTAETGYKLRLLQAIVSVETAQSRVSFNSKPSGAGTQRFEHSFPIGVTILPREELGYMDSATSEGISVDVTAGGGTVAASILYVAIPV